MFRQRRFLLMAFTSGKRKARPKQPYCFEGKEGELFAFAGLWDRWKDPSGVWTIYSDTECCDLSRPRPDASHP